MARRFLDDVRADLSAQLVTDGDTTAPQLLSLLIDTIDSTINDESALVIDIDVPLVTTTAFVPIINYDTVIGGDGDFLTPDAVAGTIKSSATAGFTYDLFGQVSFIATNNARYEFVMLRNGIESGFVAAVTGTGVSDSMTLSVDTTVLSNLSNNTVSLGLRSIVGGDAITLTQVVLKAVVKPTNNP
jgi:hypothetical protein